MHSCPQMVGKGQRGSGAFLLRSRDTQRSVRMRLLSGGQKLSSVSSSIDSPSGSSLQTFTPKTLVMEFLSRFPSLLLINSHAPLQVSFFFFLECLPGLKTENKKSFRKIFTAIKYQTNKGKTEEGGPFIKVLCISEGDLAQKILLKHTEFSPIH